MKPTVNEEHRASQDVITQLGNEATLSGTKSIESHAAKGLGAEVSPELETYGRH